MRTYEVRYWSEGPGRSHIEIVLVLAKNKKHAIEVCIKKCGVYKADQPYVTAKLVSSKEGMIIKHLGEEY